MEEIALCPNERLHIGDDVEIFFDGQHKAGEFTGERVKVFVEAPRDVPVLRCKLVGNTSGPHQTN